MSTTTRTVRCLGPVSGRTDGYCWWEITTPHGMATQRGYSADEAVANYQRLIRDARCPVCSGPLGEVRLRWYGADYCGEECLRLGRQAQAEVTREDAYWAASGSARMGLWP